MNMGARTLGPSFLKCLILPDFNRTIGVPTFFSGSYEQSLRGGKVALRIGGSDKTWDVKVEITEDGRYEFTRGWEVFAEDVGLRFGEILVCRLVDVSTFDVSTYGIHCAEWKAGRGRGYYEEEPDETSFSVILNQHHKNFMNIPIGFAKKTGIINRSYVTLRNEDGESKQVRVSIRPMDGRVGMRGEWNDYWMENDLSVGNELNFRVVGNDFGTLHVSRNGLIVPNKGLIVPNTLNKGGRPRQYA